MTVTDFSCYPWGKEIGEYGPEWMFYPGCEENPSAWFRHFNGPLVEPVERYVDGERADLEFGLASAVVTREEWEANEHDEATVRRLLALKEEQAKESLRPKVTEIWQETRHD